MADRYVYAIELTRQEYEDAAYMDARGYLGGIVEHCTVEEWSEDGERVTLQFTESDAWKVVEQCEDDEPAVWALTNMSTSLGQKFQTFRDRIV